MPFELLEWPTFPSAYLIEQLYFLQGALQDGVQGHRRGSILPWGMCSSPESKTHWVHDHQPSSYNVYNQQDVFMSLPFSRSPVTP